eukprot:g5058.t1
MESKKCFVSLQKEGRLDDAVVFLDSICAQSFRWLGGLSFLYSLGVSKCVPFKPKIDNNDFEVAPRFAKPQSDELFESEKQLDTDMMCSLALAIGPPSPSDNDEGFKKKAVIFISTFLEGATTLQISRILRLARFDLITICCTESEKAHNTLSIESVDFDFTIFSALMTQKAQESYKEIRPFSSSLPRVEARYFPSHTRPIVEIPSNGERRNNLIGFYLTASSACEKVHPYHCDESEDSSTVPRKILLQQSRLAHHIFGQLQQLNIEIKNNCAWAIGKTSKLIGNKVMELIDEEASTRHDGVNQVNEDMEDEKVAGEKKRIASIIFVDRNLDYIAPTQYKRNLADLVQEKSHKSKELFSNVQEKKMTSFLPNELIVEKLNDELSLQKLCHECDDTLRWLLQAMLMRTQSQALRALRDEIPKLSKNEVWKTKENMKYQNDDRFMERFGNEIVSSGFSQYSFCELNHGKNERKKHLSSKSSASPKLHRKISTLRFADSIFNSLDENKKTRNDNFDELQKMLLQSVENELSDPLLQLAEWLKKKDYLTFENFFLLLFITFSFFPDGKEKDMDGNNDFDDVHENGGFNEKYKGTQFKGFLSTSEITLKSAIVEEMLNPERKHEIDSINSFFQKDLNTLHEEEGEEQTRISIEKSVDSLFSFLYKLFGVREKSNCKMLQTLYTIKNNCITYQSFLACLIQHLFDREICDGTVGSNGTLSEIVSVGSAMDQLADNISKTAVDAVSAVGNMFGSWGVPSLTSMLGVTAQASKPSTDAPLLIVWVTGGVTGFEISEINAVLDEISILQRSEDNGENL